MCVWFSWEVEEAALGYGHSCSTIQSNGQTAANSPGGLEHQPDVEAEESTYHHRQERSERLSEDESEPGEVSVRSAPSPVNDFADLAKQVTVLNCTRLA